MNELAGLHNSQTGRELPHILAEREADRHRTGHFPSRPDKIASSTRKAILKPTNVGTLHALHTGSGRGICPADIHIWQTSRELLFLSQPTMVEELARFIDYEADRHPARHWPSRPSHSACSARAASF
ncbi:hypothetical protein PGT21_020550 [Puccinia graminis f. sp. tritici]|uniref:Uncharacterized protein n=1 Tax=Puccinia graminis f. sp. tritici TaxID=56615 RepID=A0A5B0NGD6_PUCGR|nr:hypothetical protein PGT21_020550 [Puccinia graminis f. sp. tritici]